MVVLVGGIVCWVDGLGMRLGEFFGWLFCVACVGVFDVWCWGGLW